jgi:hypothetical protein
MKLCKTSKQGKMRPASRIEGRDTKILVDRSPGMTPGQPQNAGRSQQDNDRITVRIIAENEQQV